MKYLAEAVFVSATNKELTPANWNLEVEYDLEQDHIHWSHLGPMMSAIQQGRCDGFTIDLGTRILEIIPNLVDK